MMSRMTKNNESKRMKAPLSIAVTGMMTALLAVLSQISIPLPTGVPVTLQTFAAVLCVSILGRKLGVLSVLLYLLLGAVGLPVFAGFGAGPGTIVGATGGFLLGFIPLSFLAGCGRERRRSEKAFFSAAGLVLCHGLGVAQFSYVTARGMGEAFLLASAPYLIKDAVSICLALAVGSAVKKRLLDAGVLPNLI